MQMQDEIQQNKKTSIQMQYNNNRTTKSKDTTA